MAQKQNIVNPREAAARAICRSCGDDPNRKGDAQGRDFRWQDYLSSADAAIAALVPALAFATPPVAFVNGDELDNMLDDRTAVIQSNRTGFRKTPLFSTAAQTLAAGDALPWNTIDSVPKDGTEVLLYLGAPWSRVAKARWFAPWSTWIEGDFPEKNDERCGIGSALPTHWMPVPLDPVAEELRDVLKGIVHDAWLPIAGVPKDGTEVLLFLGAPWNRVAIARWFEPWANWIEGEFPNPAVDEYGGIGSALPTHYMLLPAAPAASASE